MRRFSRAAVPLVPALRCCATSNSTGAAPKKPRGRVSVPGIESVRGAAAAASKLEPKAEGKLTTDELHEQLAKLAEASPEELEEMQAKFDKESAAESKVVQEDSLYQMDVSVKMRLQGGLRVFWKDVGVEEVPQFPGWYGITIDGRRVKAFETTAPLVVPGEAFAHAVAQEWAHQNGVVNKLLMPLTDLASGAMHVSSQGIAPRVDYLMSFFQNDNLYFRAEAIAEAQDILIDPIARWFERSFDVEVPRIVGIGHTHFTPAQVEKVRQQLLAMDFNQYQIIAMCVVAQHTASLMLPLAIFHRVVSLPHGLEINRAEEGHNVAEHGNVAGYHDIREADVVAKITASATAWQLTRELAAADCGPLAAAAAANEASTTSV